ncbi:MarR family winged helix-turn-helix transcriptional regulator [Paenibacillus alkalitolerans]|uniref:MarR family winged helix-turn-helix transcriptional regulator n=1 Tax=Paenibacillus alkalitolerans TaxID=2799335 RepID=UPI0018F3CFC1|nr:MarR family transcriptional regulator [Paenibacillus alkalitolerans]
MKNDHTISQELIRAIRQIGRINWTGRNSDDFTKSEKMMLYVVRRCMKSGSTGLKASELSDFLHVSSPTVTQMVNVLEAKGMLERTPDPDDRRVVRIRLTEAGQQAVDTVEQDMLEGTNGLIDHLGMERTRLLIELLDDVYQYYSDRSSVYLLDCKRPSIQPNEGESEQ